MESSYEAPLTPEQIRAVTAGGGYARCEDPDTGVVYHLIEQSAIPTIDDDYVRQKLAEAYADIERNGLKTLNMAAIKAELQQRLSAERNGSG